MGCAITPSGPLLVFGGPYGNLEATRAVFDEARHRKIETANILCTGDLTAYCADPQPVIDLIRGSGIHTIMGNCEESLAVGAADCGCGYAENSACAALAADWYECPSSELMGQSWPINQREALAHRVGD
jgi:hypothetical protein